MPSIPESPDDKFNWATSLYYKWVHQMLVVAYGGLVALIALQGGYISDNNLKRLVISLAFLSLASAVCAALILLQYEVGSAYDLARHHWEGSKEPADNQRERVINYSPSQQWFVRLSRWLLYKLILASVISLCTFALLNVWD